MGFHKSHGRKKNTSAAEGGLKILALFFGAKSRFQWENDEFWGISEFHGCKIWYIFNFHGRKILGLFFGKIERRGPFAADLIPPTNSDF